MSMSRSEIITTLQGEYALKRERNQRQLEERERRVRERSPEIGRLLDENRALLMDSSRAALKNPAKAREIMERARASAQQNRSRLGDLLEAAGFSRDALELQYDCPVCRDTGYVGQPVKRFCKCFERRMMSLAYENATMAGLEQQCFENFDLSLFLRMFRGEMGSVIAGPWSASENFARITPKGFRIMSSATCFCLAPAGWARPIC